MTDTMNADQGPIEVWLTQEPLAVRCRFVRQDERTYEPEVNSLSLRGAEREMTGYLLAKGYEPAGRWQAEADGAEVWRRFKPRREEGANA